ncbi:MAG: helix-turn-helix domain-containing protein [Clostridium sp.]|uniref:helix-turn-helix transcriptional regulator n=1 Tax=Clostridium sp. TaxID=1506 RepID=UPI0025C3A28B|nr:helix-turn-helix transcriptional regulator [Clostridium sp.]MCE5221040.1 helix-turn-helix domain-containing protein [Clostridium sp.]
MRERIRYTRAIYNLTQLDVAKALGTSKQYITQIEKNRNLVSDEKLEEIYKITVKIGEANKQGRMEDVLEDLIKNRKEEQE